MNKVIQNEGKSSQTPDKAHRGPLHNSARDPQAGHLAQFAAIADQSPQVQAQRKLASEIQDSNQVQAQMGCAAAINSAPRAVGQLRRKEDGVAAQNTRPEDVHAGRDAASSPMAAQLTQAATPAPNRTGLPDHLKSGVENLSGLSMDDVKVHYNSAKPAQLNALAYAQGSDIHVAPGQEQHLPHEAWHIVQQKQGRVKPTMQMKTGTPVNDDRGLEHEADVMGAQAVRNASQEKADKRKPHQRMAASAADTIQRKVGFEFETTWEMAATNSGSGVPQGANEKNFNVKQEIIGADGWSLHADFHGTKVAEFITAPVEESDWLEVFSQLDALETKTGTYVAPAGTAGRDGTWIQVHAVPAGEIWLKKGDAEMKAAPQITAGFRLERIPEVMKAMTARHTGGAKELLAKPEGEGVDKLSRLITTARSRVDSFFASVRRNPELEPLSGLPVDPGLTPEFKGVLSLLGMYALLGQQHAPLDYAKELSPIMSRTNLGSLPQNLRDHPKLMPGVLFVAGVGDGTGKLFRAGFLVAGVVQQLGPTIQEWVDGVRGGNDPLNAFSGGQMSNLPRLEGVSTTQTAKAVGGGYDYAHAAQGIIIELRGLKEGVPRTQWGTLAEHLRAWVVKINDTSAEPEQYKVSDAY